MPAAVLGPVLGAAIGGGTSIVAAKMGSNANKNATNAQTQAANYGADLQSKSAAEQLAFLRQAAEGNFQQQETDRRGNYDQWATDRRNTYDLGTADRKTAFDEWSAVQQYQAAQAAARGQRMNTVGAALGYGTSAIPQFTAPTLTQAAYTAPPAYVPGVDPRFDQMPPTQAQDAPLPQRYTPNRVVDARSVGSILGRG